LSKFIIYSWRLFLLKLILICILISIFAFSIFSERSQFLGKLSDGRHQWITAHSAIIVDNWIEDGIIADKALALNTPRSIEANTIFERGTYISYPTGAQLQIYVLKTVFPQINTIKLIQGFGLLNQFLTALVIFFFVQACTSFYKGFSSLLFSALASVSYILMPKPMYWHAMVYFADQAIIIYFVLVLYLEARLIQKPSNLLYWIQSIVIAWAMAIDYLTIPLVLVLMLFRVITPYIEEKKYSTRNLFYFIQLFTPILLIGLIYLYQLYITADLTTLYSKFMLRSGFGNEGAVFISSFYQQFFEKILGIDSLLVAVSIICAGFFYYKKKLLASRMILTGFLVCFLQIFILKSHSVIHEFSALKLYVPIAYGFFGLIPLMLYEGLIQEGVFLSRSRERLLRVGSKLKFALLGLIFFIFGGVLIYMHLAWMQEFPEPYFDNYQEALYIKNNFQYDDVLIGFDGFEINTFPPFKMAVARKKVYVIPSAEAFEILSKKIPVNARLNLILKTDNPCLDRYEAPQIIGNGPWSAVKNIDSQDLRFLSCIRKASN
jgi:hypothetical protein